MRWQRPSLLSSLLRLVAGHVAHAPREDDDWGTGLDQARSTIDAMMGFYNQTAGRWQPEIAWWLSGNALQALLDYMHKTGSETYKAQVQRTIDTQKEPLDWWPQGGGYFRADSTDDTGWWALAMCRMFDLTGDQVYLDYAKMDDEYMHDYWSDSCGGGIVQDIRNDEYKNAISNELYFTLAATLHNRVPDDNGTYLDRALEGWRWFNASGMINAAHLVNDGLLDSCANNGATTWTYNQGVVLGGLVELHVATGDEAYLSAARQIADAVLASGTLVVDGILREPCEAAGDCDFNQQAFKGIFARYLSRLDEALAGRPYRSFLVSNARRAWEKARNDTGYFAVGWNGPFVNSTVATQASAASLMIAAMDVGV